MSRRTIRYMSDEELAAEARRVSMTAGRGMLKRQIAILDEQISREEAATQ